MAVFGFFSSFSERRLFRIFSPLLYNLFYKKNANKLIFNKFHEKRNATFEVAKIDNCIGKNLLPPVIIINKKPLIFFLN